MTESDRKETTRGGLVGKVAGKLKETAGEALDNDELAREGRLQQAQAEAEGEAEVSRREAEQKDNEADLEAERLETETKREQLQAEVNAQKQAEDADRERRQVERKANLEEAGEKQSAEQRVAAAEREADRREREALADRRREKGAAATLTQEARRAQASSRSDRPEGAVMSLQSIPGALLSSTLRIIRVPLDGTLRLGGDSTKAARVMVDRADEVFANTRACFFGMKAWQKTPSDARRRRMSVDMRCG